MQPPDDWAEFRGMERADVLFGDSTGAGPHRGHKRACETGKEDT
jgi:hypothetical protein